MVVKEKMEAFCPECFTHLKVSYYCDSSMEWWEELEEMNMNQYFDNKGNWYPSCPKCGKSMEVLE